MVNRAKGANALSKYVYTQLQALPPRGTDRYPQETRMTVTGMEEVGAFFFYHEDLRMRT